ncbi:MAG: transposase [Thermoplasmatota archaeon]
MRKAQLVNQFTKSLIKEKHRKNKVSTQQITSTLITAAISLAFVNESCQSSGMVSKSQVIYRKLEGKTIEEVQAYYRAVTIRFLKMLKLFSRNRRFLLSFDPTEEAFYGDLSKAEDKLYLHPGSIARGSDYYYEYLTVTITCIGWMNYILDGMIIPMGCYVEDVVYEITKFLLDHLPVEMVLFDRGFDSWGIVYKIQQLPVTYLIFWKKQGDWYKEPLDKLKDGECTTVVHQGTYNREKSPIQVRSQFVLIKQLEYEGETYDWLFATNRDKTTATSYVKRYKKRWAIETIFRVTDDIRIYTTSTDALIRYFLFMFTCLVYNIWKFFQLFLGERFTLANMKICMIIFMAKHGIIYPEHYDKFEKIAEQFFNV